MPACRAPGCRLQDAPTTLAVRRAVLSALRSLHVRGIAHGDLRDDNIMVATSERVAALSTVCFFQKDIPEAHDLDLIRVYIDTFLDQRGCLVVHVVSHIFRPAAVRLLW